MLYISFICVDGVGDMNKEYESAIKEIDKLGETKREDKNKKHEERWREAYTQLFGKDLNLQKMKIRYKIQENSYMICKICGEETDNPGGICDECKFSVINIDEIPPNMEKKPF